MVCVRVGIGPALLGTILLTLGTAIVAMPLAIGAAIYLAEYAPNNWVTRQVRLAIVNLAGIPSIVYGLFGLGMFVLFLGTGTSILAGSLTLGLMTLPVVISTAEEAILSVPPEFRTVSLSLGATKWQTIRNHVLPHATPGIITGVILGLSRAAGETAPILFYCCGVLFAGIAEIDHGSDDGAAVSPVCDFNAGTGHADRDSVRHGTGVAAGCFVVDDVCHDCTYDNARRRREW